MNTINNQSKPIPSWTTFPIKEFEKGLKGCKSVLMGDYLIIFARDKLYDPEEPYFDDDYSDLENYEPAVLVAIDLRDNSVQEVVLEDSFCHKDFYIAKYKENQIIKFAGLNRSSDASSIYRITIKSFKPLKVVCQDIANEPEGSRSHWHAAQIHEDALYICGNKTWRFDLIKLKWKKLKTQGESPDEWTDASSFLIEDNMYIYGGDTDEVSTKNDIFVLNLKTLIWTHLPQQINLNRSKIEGDIYQGNLLITDFDGSETDKICYWDRKNNSWSTHKIQKGFLANRQSNLIVHKNLLLAIASKKKECFFGILDLRNIEFPTLESPEQKHIKSLFMSEQESDIKFKVQDRIIPAHKKVLIAKSEYFDGLFNSGMVESRQEVIDINECEFSTFQEFLRFLYCDFIQLDADLAIKLFPLTDKYVEEDLNERCLHHLAHNINPNNVYAILDFAFQHGFSHLVTGCLHVLKKILNSDNVSKLMGFIESQTHSKYTKDLSELKKRAVEIITREFWHISNKQEEKLPFFLDFLLKSVEMGTLRCLILFNWARLNESDESDDKLNKARLHFEKKTANLRKKIRSFVQENFANLKMNKILVCLPSPFWLDFTSMILENPEKIEAQGLKADDKDSKSKVEEEKDSGKGSRNKGKKRKEPVKTEEAKPELKKTKK